MIERDPQQQDKYIVRFPPGMRDRLKEAAAANNRSMNAEIVARLQKSLEGGQAPDPLPSEVVAEVYRSHAMAMEAQATALHREMVHLLNSRATAAVGTAEREALDERIAQVEARLHHTDKLILQLQAQAQVPPRGWR